MDLREIKCVNMWTGFIWLCIGISMCSCKHCNESSGSMKGGEFHDQPPGFSGFEPT
jgi:hypothetical protein